MKAPVKTPRQQAMDLLAACDTPDAAPPERHVARLARTWLSMLGARQSVQGMVNRIMDEFAHTPPEGYGCCWDELKAAFTAWAVAEEWWPPKRKSDTARRRDYA
jgi:hypothetical protein